MNKSEKPSCLFVGFLGCSKMLHPHFEKCGFRIAFSTLLILLMLTIPLVSALNINSIDIPTQVKSNEIFEIRLNLENNEDDTIRNINIDLNLGDLPFKILSQDGADKITRNNDETIFLVLQALPGSLSKAYSIPATITYRIEDRTEKKETALTVVINEKPVLDATARSEPIIIGEKSTITIKIVNKGLSDVKFLNVKIAPEGFTLLSEDQQYIGEISSDDFDSVDFEILPNKNSPSSIKPNVILTYEDIAGNKYSETKNIELKVYDSKEAESLGLLKRNNAPYIIIGVIILVILFFIYRIIRKRKK